ncbi:hypothetical protein [Escherichia coli]|uniref:F4 family fimbrial subunit n=1 Tax=Escherichia coli TaxID=562 RepID=UPI0010E8C4D2|nr:hypothetical protein [Escherichia coli]GDM79691.1 hypothetical protein BvCmsKSP083_04584 [Escherichia coli]
MVNDILFIIVLFLSLLIGGKVSADAGWQSGGDFQGTVEFGGTITPYDDSLPPGLWKTGRYTGFSNKISELTGNGPRLTVSAPYDLLLLAGKSARASEDNGNTGTGAACSALSVTGDTQTATHWQQKFSLSGRLCGRKTMALVPESTRYWGITVLMLMCLMAASPTAVCGAPSFPDDER